MKSKGYAAATAESKLEPFAFERREPREHDVVLDVKFCGICHTDIHITRGEFAGAIFPVVPGHEVAGVVTEVGSSVTKFKKGDKIGVGCMVDSCRTCAQCQQGLEQYCANTPVWTYNSRDKDGAPTYGGYSNNLVVDENYALHMPANLALGASAPLLCAGITLYSPLRHWKAGPGKKVAIVGLGGLGHMGVKIAHAMGAEVTVLSHSSRKAADAKRLGADHFVDTSAPGALKNLKSSFNLIINTVSDVLDWNQYTELLAVDGSFVVVGIPGKAVPVEARNLIGNRRSIAGSQIGGIRETQEMLDFCAKHQLPCDVEVISIEKVNEAYERILKGDVRYRFVIDMATLK
jgi:alcohol dehydrogenase (NADP+)